MVHKPYAGHIPPMYPGSGNLGCLFGHQLDGTHRVSNEALSANYFPILLKMSLGMGYLYVFMVFGYSWKHMFFQLVSKPM